MSTLKPNLGLLERIKRSEIPNAEVYVAEEPMQNQNTIGDDDFPMDDDTSQFPKRAARTNPVLYERLKEQETIANTPLVGKEMRDKDQQVYVANQNRYIRLMLGGALGFLLILAFKNFGSITAILKKLF